ncbi:MAG TPA: ABC transporter permease, partial [Phormidium sp.]
MAINFIDKIGDLNPQTWREIKGRLKPRNIVISVAISLLTQFFIFQHFLTRLPAESLLGRNHQIYNPYCTDELSSREIRCFRDSLGNFIINWESWNRDLFVCLSFV